jgi:hypothetical protein
MIMSNYSTDYQQPTPTLQPPPKKRRTWLVVLFVILALSVVGIAACAALVGTAGNAISEGLTETTERAEPREVTEGEEFTIGSHETLAGWDIKKDTSLGEPTFMITGKVTNVSDTTSTAFIHFKMINSKGEVIGNVDCNSGDLEPGQTQALNCIPDGTWGKYTKITAEATF